MTYQTKGKCTCCEQEGTLNMISDDVWLCQECTDAMCTRCDVCEEYWLSGGIEFTVLPDGRHVCQYCMEDLDDL